MATAIAQRRSDVNPYLQGNFAPWRMEGEALDLDVTGEIPRDLCGIFYRNGSNPAYQPVGRYHWFDGDGMVHAIRLENGRAHYRNRWVMSDGLEEERAARRALFPGFLDFSLSEWRRAPKNTGNTNVVSHAGKLLALVEYAPPTELRPRTLETIGVYDFAGRLSGGMTAHPKIDAESGEMLCFSYSPFPPYLQYYVVDRDGAIIHAEPIDVAWPSMVHDFAVTERHTIFVLSPLVLRLGNTAETGTIFSWEPERGTRIGVLPRRGRSSDVRWFETNPCFIFHAMNAYEQGSKIVLDVARYEEMLFTSQKQARERGRRDKQGARLHRWRIDLAKGTLRSQPLDDHEGEFPRVDERLVGRKHRFGYFASVGPEGSTTPLPEFTAIAKIDADRGRVEVRAHGTGNGCSEPVFIPRRKGAAEDDGFVVYLAYDRERNASDFVIVDVRDFGGEPIARVRLPHRVPYGFHGNWAAAE